MSRFLHRELLHVGPPKCAAAAAPALLRHLLQTPLARPLSRTPYATAAEAADVSISGDDDTHPHPTVSYLIHSCGLSLEAALSAAKKVRLTTTENPDSVLALLKDNGCSPTQVAAIVSKFPELLRMRATETLKPKLDFLRGAGISGPRLAVLLATNPNLLSRSLEKKIAPSLDLLRRVLPPGVALADALRFSPRLNPEEQLPNVETLRLRGVPNAGITKLLLTRPLSLTRPPARFEEIVTAVEAMGLEPANSMFPDAVGVMSFTSRETWERKVALYQSLGWSDGEISAAFARQPNFLALSDAGIRQKMEFFAGKLGLTPATLCKAPSLMLFSLEKRVAPRCAVLKVLMKGGLLQRKVSLVAALRMPETGFVERFVDKYREEAPEVVDAHLGKLEFHGFGTLAKKWVAQRVCRGR